MIEEEKSRTELSALGEFGLIDRLTADVKIFHQQTIKGVGDDAAVIDAGDRFILVSTDLLVEGVHFDLTYTPLKHLGYKAAVVNFSDICAMNGVPKQITVGLAVSNRFPVEALDEFYDGLKLACEHYKVDIVGGDTTSSTAGMFISITVLGDVEKDDVVYRSGAKEHDLICVSGDLGGAYAGLLLLEREKAVFKADPEMQPDLEGYDYPLERQLKPEARTDIVKALKEAGLRPTSMIDISDGLASEIIHLCKNSQAGAALYEDKFPVDAATVTLAEEFKLDPTTLALNGGEDYELLFTIPITELEHIRKVSNIAVIGHITDKKDGICLITRSGQSVPVLAQGWDALRNRG